MENAADALKMAIFVLLFVSAISISVFMLTKARTTSQMVLEENDDRKYYSYIEVDDTTNHYETERYVSINEILPTLYRYYKENYTVKFVNSNRIRYRLI